MLNGVGEKDSSNVSRTSGTIALILLPPFPSRIPSQILAYPGIMSKNVERVNHALRAIASKKWNIFTLSLVLSKVSYICE